MIQEDLRNRLSMRIAQRGGRLAGEIAAPIVFPFLELGVRGMSVRVLGSSNLQHVKEFPCVLVGNHQRPVVEGKNSVSLESSKISPDSFILRYLVRRASSGERNLVFTGHYDFPEPGLGEAAFKGWYEGLGIIPVTKRPGRLNRDLVVGVREAIRQGDSVLFYPQGVQKDDFDQKQILHTGAASLAKRYEVPIVPFYIQGADQWKKQKEIDVAFGKLIDPNGKSTGETTQEIKASMLVLQQQVRANSRV